MIEPADATITPDVMTARPGVSLRPSSPADRAFLGRVYASSRADEMALLADWTDEQKDAFLRFQFEAQHAHYRAHYPDARYDVIVDQGEDVGRFYVARMPDEIRIVDLTLLPAHRRCGIGGSLVRRVLDEACRDGKVVSLHVEVHNPARRLYERLGFTVAEERGIYQLLHWMPPARPLACADGAADAEGRRPVR